MLVLIGAYMKGIYDLCMFFVSADLGIVTTSNVNIAATTPVTFDDVRGVSKILCEMFRKFKF